MALRIPILRAQRAFFGPYVEDTPLMVAANGESSYSFPSGNVASMACIFNTRSFNGSSGAVRRVTRMVVKVKGNVPRGAWEWAPCIILPNETLQPVNGWAQIPQFAYDPNQYIPWPVPGSGPGTTPNYFYFEYPYPWPSGLDPSASAIALRGKSGTMPANGRTFVEFQFWDDDSATPPNPGGGGDPPIDPNTEIPMEHIETQSYDNLGGSGVRTIPNNGATTGALTANGILAVQFDMESTFPSWNGDPLDYGNPNRLMQYYTGTNTIYAWRTNTPILGGVDLTESYVQWKFRGFVRKITKARITYYVETLSVHPLYCFIGSNDEASWVTLSEDFSFTGSPSQKVTVEIPFFEGEVRYKYIRLLCVTGNMPANRTQQLFMIEFEISGVPWEKGDRRSALSISSNIAKYSVGNQGGFPSNVFDDLFMFDGDSFWYWVSAGNGPGSYAVINFPAPIRLRSLLWFSAASNRALFNQGDWVLQGSNNRYNWHDLTTFSRTGNTGARHASIVIPGELSPYRYYRLLCTGGGTWNTDKFEANLEWQFDIEGVYEENALPEPLVTETTSYQNLGGSGARADAQGNVYSTFPNMNGWTLDVSTTFAYNSTIRSPTRLIEGIRNSSAAGYSFGWTAQDVAGKELRFTMRGRPRVIDEFTWYQSAVGSHGMFKFQGSEDGSVWQTLKEDFELGTATTQVVSFENTKPYHAYRLLGVSGTTNSTPWLQEIEFRISGLPFERGDRRAEVTATTDMPPHAADASSPTLYTFSNLINGLYGGQNDTPSGYGWRPQQNMDITGKHMTFEFPYPVRVIGIFLLQSYDRSEARPAGTWAVLVSNDGENWENVGTIELTVAGAQGWHNGPDAKGTPAKFLRLYGIEGGTDSSNRFWREFEFEFALPEGDPFETEFKDDGEFYAELSDVNWENLALNFTDDSELDAELDIEAEPFDVNFRDKTVLLAELTVIHTNPDHPIVQVIPNHSN